MSIFDQIVNSIGNQVTSSAKSALRSASHKASQKATEGVNKAIANAQKKKVDFTFEAIPATVEEFKALPEAAKLTDPFCTAALTVVALAAYANDKEAGLAMLNVLSGPAPVSNLEIQRADLAFKERKYIPMSYFNGATVDNDYTPEKPYKVTVIQTTHSDDSISEGYKKLFVYSSGADTERHISLRTKPSTGEWFLNDFAALIVSIRTPKSANPWA